MNITNVAKLLELKESELTEFCETDPYNNQEVKGYISRRSDHRYGALLIYEVNGFITRPQIIYCTPKLYYPFGKDQDEQRSYTFPKINRVYVYNKLDGTNICRYTYRNHLDELFVSFKTRLTPFLRQSKFGDFYSLWNEVLELYPEIKNLGKNYGTYSMSFEMYGYRNPHLISYDVALDARLLFLVDKTTAEILPPVNDPVLERINNKIVLTITSRDDLIASYQKLRRQAQLDNKVCDDGTIQGTEGFVFYTYSVEEDWNMYKCKPEMIEEIHWANNSISYHSIVTTILNSLENRDTIDNEFVVQLLKEEYSEQQIHNSDIRIRKAIEAVQEKIDLTTKVKEAFQSYGLSSFFSKSDIMRTLSSSFSKSDMRKIFTILRELNLIKE